MDGRYPSDLSTPVTLSDLMRMPESQLDRLLEEYEISFHGRSSYDGRDRAFDLSSSRESLVHKLSSLLDFLGAHQIADVLRSGAESDRSSSRQFLTGRLR